MESNKFKPVNLKINETLKVVIDLFSKGTKTPQYKVLTNFILTALPIEIKKLEDEDLQKTIMKMLKNCK